MRGYFSLDTNQIWYKHLDNRIVAHKYIGGAAEVTAAKMPVRLRSKERHVASGYTEIGDTILT